MDANHMGQLPPHGAHSTSSVEHQYAAKRAPTASHVPDAQHLPHVLEHGLVLVFSDEVVPWEGCVKHQGKRNL